MLPHLIWMFAVGYALFLLGYLREKSHYRRILTAIGISAMAIITAFASLVFLVFVPTLHHNYEVGRPEMVSFLALMLLSGLALRVIAHLTKKNPSKRFAAAVGAALIGMALVFTAFLLFHTIDLF